jgi:PIN domain nuclease of toxin-antitoxin system
MRVLLDTHVFLWANTAPHRLGKQRALLEDRATDLLFSAASSWEIAIKYTLDRLPLPVEPSRYVPDRIRVLGAIPVPVEHSHALAVAELPRHHEDPFDRLLIAQAQTMRIAIVTADHSFDRYDVDLLVVD